MSYWEVIESRDTRTSPRSPGHELQGYEQTPSHLDITLIAGVME